MNKFVLIVIFIVILIAVGVVYQTYFRPADVAPIAASGHVVEIDVRVHENSWRWDPDVITVKAGDTVKLKIFNDDAYDHGFALEAFGINKKLSPRQETLVEFVAAKKGDFPFYCSVPCGEGHYEQTGHVIVTD
ncbi:MAG: cupredoxin domain-containing protein [Patescibacteria group bacterium]